MEFFENSVIKNVNCSEGIAHEVEGLNHFTSTCKLGNLHSINYSMDNFAQNWLKISILTSNFTIIIKNKSFEKITRKNLW